jgi:hypothetical protein
MKKILCLLFPIFTICNLKAQQVQSIYISNCGSDNYNASSALADATWGNFNTRAFKTLEGALKRIRDNGHLISTNTPITGWQTADVYSTLNTSNYLVQDYIFEATNPYRLY